MNRLHLVRHSLTRANEARLYCGWTDVPLSPAGRALAERLRDDQEWPRCEKFAVTGLQRTAETLKLLYGDVPAAVLPDLREMNFGEFEMHSYEELCARSDYLRWIEDETGDVACPGGESKNVFQRRVADCAAALLSRKDIGEMLILCHGGVIATLMQKWFPKAGRHFYQWQPPACGGYSIEIKNGAAMAFEMLK